MKRHLSKKQLLWKCRRGSKELELILNQFVSDCYHELSDNEKTEFNKLLAVEDPILTQWLCYNVTPVGQTYGQVYGQGMIKIVSRILSAYPH